MYIILFSLACMPMPVPPEGLRSEIIQGTVVEGDVVTNIGSDRERFYYDVEGASAEDIQNQIYGENDAGVMEPYGEWSLEIDYDIVEINNTCIVDTHFVYVVGYDVVPFWIPPSGASEEQLRMGHEIMDWFSMTSPTLVHAYKAAKEAEVMLQNYQAPAPCNVRRKDVDRKVDSLIQDIKKRYNE